MKVIQNDMAEAMCLVLAIGTLVQIVGNLSETILIGVISLEALAGINVLTFIFAYIQRLCKGIRSSYLLF